MSKPVILYVFNPEHDLCLANGDPNYVPPRSALDFARRGKRVMKMIYGDDIMVIAADDFAEWREGPEGYCADVVSVVPWGWDARTRQVLIKQGLDESLLPTLSYINKIRELQHRTTILSLQSDAFAVHSADEVNALLTKYPRLVLKAPWSGSGRGLRWIDGELSSHDEAWIKKTSESQECIVAEERYEVRNDFAFEFYAGNGSVRMVGLSLFVTQSGVYRYNILLSDNDIRSRVGVTSELEKSLQQWLLSNIAPFYNGYLGVDFLQTADGRLVVSELNLRHTMGLAAHCALCNNSDLWGQTWSPELINDN